MAVRQTTNHFGHALFAWIAAAISGPFWVKRYERYETTQLHHRNENDFTSTLCLSVRLCVCVYLCFGSLCHRYCFMNALRVPVNPLWTKLECKTIERERDISEARWIYRRKIFFFVLFFVAENVYFVSFEWRKQRLETKNGTKARKYFVLEMGNHRLELLMWEWVGIVRRWRRLSRSLQWHRASNGVLAWAHCCCRWCALGEKKKGKWGLAMLHPNNFNSACCVLCSDVVQRVHVLISFLVFSLGLSHLISFLWSPVFEFFIFRWLVRCLLHSSWILDLTRSNVVIVCECLCVSVHCFKSTSRCVCAQQYTEQHKRAVVYIVSCTDVWTKIAIKSKCYLNIENGRRRQWWRHI